MGHDRGKPKFSDKALSQWHVSHHKAHRLARNQPETSAVTGLRLSASSMERSCFSVQGEKKKKKVKRMRVASYTFTLGWGGGGVKTHQFVKGSKASTARFSGRAV
jgi:hypothetical protein